MCLNVLSFFLSPPLPARQAELERNPTQAMQLPLWRSAVGIVMAISFPLQLESWLMYWH